MYLQSLPERCAPESYGSLRTRQQQNQGISSQSTASSPSICRIPGENCIFSGGGASGQSVYVEYTANATEEDPIVRISGESLSGSFEQEVHINDIDPSFASYAEMCALIGHLNKTGAYQQNRNSLLSPVPLDVDRGDYAQKKDFMRLI